jgi:hypothetical protein
MNVFPLMQVVLVFHMCHTPGERSYFTNYTSLIKEKGKKIFVSIKDNSFEYDSFFFSGNACKTGRLRNNV